MKWRLFAVMMILGLLGWWGLVVIQRQFAVGEFATSPQSFDLMPGRKAIVAGGRGLLTFIDKGRHRVLIEVRCADERQTAELGEGRTSEEVCDLTVRWSGATPRLDLPPGTQRFEVMWDAEPNS